MGNDLRREAVAFEGTGMFGLYHVVGTISDQAPQVDDAVVAMVPTFGWL